MELWPNLGGQFKERTKVGCGLDWKQVVTASPGPRESREEEGEVNKKEY